MEKSNLNYAADNYSKLQGQKLIRSTGLLKSLKGYRAHSQIKWRILWFEEIVQTTKSRHLLDSNFLQQALLLPDPNPACSPAPIVNTTSRLNDSC